MGSKQVGWRGKLNQFIQSMYVITSNETQENQILAGQAHVNSEWELNTQKNHEKQCDRKIWTKNRPCPHLGELLSSRNEQADSSVLLLCFSLTLWFQHSPLSRKTPSPLSPEKLRPFLSRFPLPKQRIPQNISPAARPKSLHQKAPPPSSSQRRSSITASRFPCNVSHFHSHLQPTPEIHWHPIMGRQVASRGSSTWQARQLQESPRIGVYNRPKK